MLWRYIYIKKSSPTLKIDAAATWQPVSRSVTSTFDSSQKVTSTDSYYCKWKARLVDVLMFNTPYGNSSILFINIVRQFGAVCAGSVRGSPSLS